MEHEKLADQHGEKYETDRLQSGVPGQGALPAPVKVEEHQRDESGGERKKESGSPERLFRQIPDHLPPVLIPEEGDFRRGVADLSLQADRMEGVVVRQRMACRKSGDRFSRRFEIGFGLDPADDGTGSIRALKNCGLCLQPDGSGVRGRGEKGEEQQKKESHDSGNVFCC